MKLWFTRKKLEITLNVTFSQKSIERFERLARDMDTELPSLFDSAFSTLE